MIFKLFIEKERIHPLLGDAAMRIVSIFSTVRRPWRTLVDVLYPLRGGRHKKKKRILSALPPLHIAFTNYILLLRVILSKSARYRLSVNHMFTIDVSCHTPDYSWH